MAYNSSVVNIFNLTVVVACFFFLTFALVNKDMKFFINGRYIIWRTAAVHFWWSKLKGLRIVHWILKHQNLFSWKKKGREKKERRKKNFFFVFWGLKKSIKENEENCKVWSELLFSNILPFAVFGKRFRREGGKKRKNGTADRLSIFFGFLKKVSCWWNGYRLHHLQHLSSKSSSPSSSPSSSSLSLSSSSSSS